VSQRSPRAIGVCQRCGFWYQRSELVPQYDYEGVKLQNLELYVCTRTCYDKPQTQLKTIIIPADPLPVYRPLPENFAAANSDAPAGLAPPVFTVGPPVFKAEPVDDENWEEAETGDLPDPNNPSDRSK
jgi:hypothetical protein